MHLSYFLYIDPGTGSLIAQVILAGVAACALFFKNTIRKIFKRTSMKHTEEPNSKSDLHQTEEDKKSG